jgi:hypothetical protein
MGLGFCWDLGGAGGGPRILGDAAGAIVDAD